jgi:hypothetical protein
MTKENLSAWAFVIAALLGGAGLSGTISKGELTLSLICVALSLLLGMWGVFLTIHAPKEQVVCSLIISTMILYGGIYVFDRNSKISPANKTIALYEANDCGRKIWKGLDHVAINLMEHPLLQAETPPENLHTYILHPAIRHDSNGLILRIRLFLQIPDTCELKPLSWVFDRKNWVPPNKIDGATIYDTTLELIEDGAFHPTAEFGFESPKGEACEITYRFYGTDDKGRAVMPKETKVTMILN